MKGKAEAKKGDAEAYQEADYKQRHPKETQDTTLLQAIYERLDHIKSRKSITYYNENRRYLKLLIDKVGDISLSEITKTDIEALLSETSQMLGIDRRGNYTVNAMIRAISYKRS